MSTYRPVRALAQVASLYVVLVACTLSSTTDAAPGWPMTRAFPGLSLVNITGVWAGVGDQFSANVWSAYFKENTLPACDAASSYPMYTYKHWNERFPDMIAIMYNATTDSGTVIQGHQNGTYIWEHVKYSAAYKLSYTYEGEAGCVTFVPYIDHRNGYVYAQSIYKSEWRRTADNKVTQTDITCHMKEVETAGCYPQGADAVHTVSVATHKCQGGNCLNYAPAFLESHH